MTQRILMTGANGFLGRVLVRQAREAGASVVALTRTSKPIQDWASDPQITQVSLDLGHADAVAGLASALEGVDAVIHAAASMGGTPSAHARDTLGATEHLLQALSKAQSTPKPKLVLVSSLSVYDVAAMPDAAILTEETPCIREAHQRDAYAAAKVAQENLVLASHHPSHIVRPGVIYGPNRLWNAHLGFAKAGRVVCPGGDSPIAAVYVEHAAGALIAAAKQTFENNITNLIDPSPPSQQEWLQALGLPMIRLPRKVVLMAGKLLGRGAAWQARFRPLHYDLSRSDALFKTPLDHTFSSAIARSKEQEPS